MAQINADQNEVKALRAIGYNAHQTGEHVAAITSRGTLTRLEREGLTEPDPQWSGCVQLTPAGRERLAYWDSEDSGYQEDGPTEDGIRQLRGEAGTAGDLEQVAVCDRALSGDAQAWAECERVIEAARG